MRTKKSFIFFAEVFIFIFFFHSCSSGQEKNIKKDDNIKEQLIRVNKMFVTKQSDAINAYIKKHGLVMSTTPSGLRIKIEKTGKGPVPGINNKVSVNYTASLLDGAEYYSSKSLGPLVFTMGYEDVPHGVREAVVMMAKGDKAIAILPSHLGYGLTGDGKKIPPNAILIYKLELIEIK